MNDRRPDASAYAVSLTARRRLLDVLPWAVLVVVVVVDAASNRIVLSGAYRRPWSPAPC